jgi:hypothetical protein
MNTESLSVSIPWSENGSCRRTSINTVLRSACSRTSNGAHSVQPVAISVRHQRLNKTPAASRVRCGQPDRLRQSPAPDPSSRRTFVSECSVAMCSPPADCASARAAVGSYLAPGRSSTRSLPAASRGFQTPDPCGRAVPSTRSEAAAAPSVSCRKSAPTPPKELPAHFVQFPRKSTTSTPNRRLPDIASEQGHRMLSMEARHNYKLVKYARLLGAACLSVALPHNGRQFSSSRHTQLPHHCPHSPIPPGSKLREATAQHSGTFKATQNSGVVKLRATTAMRHRC